MVIKTNNSTDFEDKGYFILDDFLNSEEHSSLSKLYNDIKIEGIDGRMYSNVHHLNQDENIRIEKSIINICESSIAKVLDDYQVMGASFMVKGTGRYSDSRLHQDWSIVDESRYNSYILWIPLIDVSESNGCLQVLPESHKWFNTVRSSNIESLFLEFNYKINSFVKAIPLKSTQAAIFFSKLFHGSKINTTSSDRPAISITLIDKSAKYVHYFRDSDKRVLVLESINRYEFKNTFNFEEQRENKSVSVIGSIGDVSDLELKESSFFRKLYKDIILPYPLKAIWLYLKQGFNRSFTFNKLKT